eukprot:CAMPEP_0202893488 /NCGR_PEP_ID=MMETSP1392-20130828/3066_1 /ASSEMBLY_ACC=CAM_ASM_000868 /TAXON_ID=225041 /ORGANISM="Chlamydomonas chlamydogama, Strain SAG 11-48b" /LENGTH=117 /DNA_ID=CAMNT_0049577837 /DNA_START=321 /DNA_END=674 /DNA_ORIENTATION=+
MVLSQWLLAVHFAGGGTSAGASAARGLSCSFKLAPAGAVAAWAPPLSATFLQPLPSRNSENCLSASPLIQGPVPCQYLYSESSQQTSPTQPHGSQHHMILQQSWYLSPHHHRVPAGR